MARAMEQRALGRGRSDRAARRQASGSGAHGISRGRGGFDVGKPHARSLGPLLRIDQLPRIANYVLGAVVLVEARGKPDRRRRSFRRSWHEEGGERKEMEQERALPREALCRMPRLTPWLTLLPCRDKAGLTTLLDRQTIYSGMYHSQRLLITSGDFDRDEEGTTLEQVVFRKLQDWTLSSMFGSKLVGKCPLATTSSVYLELEESLAKHLAGDLSEETGINFADSRVFSLSPAPSRVLASSSGSLFLAHTASSAPVDWSPARAQFYTSWYLAGSGNARGSIVISFRANDGSSRDCYSPGIEAAEDDTEVCSFEWPHATGFVGLPKRGVLGLMRFTPAEDRKAPAAVEIALRVSIATQAITLDDPFRFTTQEGALPRTKRRAARMRGIISSGGRSNKNAMDFAKTPVIWFKYMV
ncbi:uncharacterized protein LOC112340462 isoform X1 [Selaginella moellendorffii]|nr:uncharacterized protein LOC112340462 isoform X1 [Selaginella moellendorffii]|eukprot:XP_024523472.1 uncharacterized protein LOC112340462 isoform X1 [Selaginella moellendorffii]